MRYQLKQNIVYREINESIYVIDYDTKKLYRSEKILNEILKKIENNEKIGDNKLIIDFLLKKGIINSNE